MTKKKADKTEWTRGALYAAALAVRAFGDGHVAEEVMGALGIKTIADLIETGVEPYDGVPLAALLIDNDPAVFMPDALTNNPAAADAEPTAVLTDAGWVLTWWAAGCGDVAAIPWPFGEWELDADDLRKLQFGVAARDLGIASWPHAH